MIINTNFKGAIRIDAERPMRSGIKVDIKHKNGWRPLFDLAVEDIMKLFSNRKKRKIK